jgi:hypothetical protein
MLCLGGKSVFGRLVLETQPTKTPKTRRLASPTQAETASRIFSTGLTRSKRDQQRGCHLLATSLCSFGNE